MQILNLGNLALTLEGFWDENRAYRTNSVVRHNYAAWGAKRDIAAGEEPGTSQNWMMIWWDNNMGYELCEVYHFRSPILRPGFQPAQGGLIANAAALYPEAWAYLQTAEGQMLCKTEAEWLALSVAAPWNGIGGVPWFVQDLAAGKLRLMDLRGMYAEAQGFDGLGVGGRHFDAIVNITGLSLLGPRVNNSNTELLSMYAEGGANSALHGLEGGPMPSFYMNPDGVRNETHHYLRFDASRVVRTANKVAPRAWGALACIYLGQPQGV